MGREVRRVPADWRHPKAFNDYRQREEYVPLLMGDYAARAADWDEEWAKWQEGLCRSYGTDADWEPIDPKDRNTRYTEYAGPRPSPDDFMPTWTAEEATHYMMYEDTSEGTPISPAFETPEELAQWLADTGASSFANHTATYGQWLAIARGGWAPSAVVENGVMLSGVEALAIPHEPAP